MKLLALLVWFGLISTGTVAADWQGCADDLDHLRNASHDAFDVANKVKSISDDVANCKKYPDIFDRLRDGCLSVTASYQTAIGNLETELNRVESRIHSVNSSCGTGLPAIATPVDTKSNNPNSWNRLCELFRSYKDALPPATLMKTCAQSMPDAECLKCLGK
jgi:hypothetical protein